MRPEKGYSYETYAVKRTNSLGEFLSHFDINPEFHRAYGVDDPGGIVKVRCTVTDTDLSVKEMYADRNYDENCIDYLAFLKYEEDFRIVMPNIKMFNCCFPYGADASCFNREGERTGTICRLKVEII